MNILLLTYQGDIAGSTNSIAYLATGLQGLGHTVYVGCRKESLLYTMLSGTSVQVIPMTFNGRFDLKNARHIASLAKEKNIHIVNAQSTYDRYTTVLAKYLFGSSAKIIHTRRQISRSMGGFFQNLFYYRGTDHVVAVSEGVKDSLVKGGIPKEHIKVIYNGTPQDKYHGVDEHKVQLLKKKFDIGENDFIIGCVSRMKNQYQIIEALRYIESPLKIIFVGIERQEKFDNFLSVNHLPHVLYYEGIVSGEDVLNYYPVFNVKVLASTQEGLSQAILESMALGTPVIATNYSGNPEIIRDGENGLLFEDGDSMELSRKILTLRNNDKLREKIIKNARKTALEDFSIEKTVKNYNVFFRGIVNAQHE